jgi:flagellar hook-length control protein FliK
MAAKLERAMSKVAVEPMVRASSSGELANSSAQASGVQSGASASKGLTSSANRAGLDGSQQPAPTLDPFNEPEPLPGSVRLRGLRGARINVPTDDGEVISARLNVHDEQVDIRLTAPEGSSQLAEQRASELRQALSSHGMELGEFDVSTSDGQSPEMASGEESGDSSSGESNSTSGDAAVDPWGRPVGTETQRGSAADGRGALLDLRL